MPAEAIDVCEATEALVRIEAKRRRVSGPEAQAIVAKAAGLKPGTIEGIVRRRRIAIDRATEAAIGRVIVQSASLEIEEWSRLLATAEELTRSDAQTLREIQFHVAALARLKARVVVG